MSFLSSEIEKAKRKFTTPTTTHSKFQRKSNGDRSNPQISDTLEGKNQSTIHENDTDLPSKSSQSIDAHVVVSLNNPDSQAPQDNEAFNELDSYPLTRVYKMLRELGQPITLFGETSDQRLLRLKRVYISSAARQTSTTGSNTRKEIEDNTKLKERDEQTLQETKTQLLEKVHLEKYRREKYEHERFRDDFSSKHRYCIYIIKRYLWLWENDLTNRSIEESNTILGKRKYTEYQETRQYLRPFFALCKEKTIDTEILDFITQLFIHIQDREYVKANEVYLQLAIGNKPWPMGVSNVGIHERVSRARIATSAHIMNSEETRKYIIAMKRILTYTQQQFPTDPSKMFLAK